MRIAAISDDGVTISQHFGYARYYVVETVEAGVVSGKETRPKAGHGTMQEHHAHGMAGQPHGYDVGAQARHDQMVENIKDCQLVIAGGMGRGARDSLKAVGIDVVVTDVKDIDEAIKLYAEGKLPNLTERLH